MPYKLNAANDNTTPKYAIRFRGAALIPYINQMAPCRMNLTMDTIKGILESLYRRPMRLEVKYVDANQKEWEINYTNYRKILPAGGSVPPLPQEQAAPIPPATEPAPEPELIPVATEEMIGEGYQPYVGEDEELDDLPDEYDLDGAGVVRTDPAVQPDEVEVEDLPDIDDQTQDVQPVLKTSAPQQPRHSKNRHRH